MPTTLSMTHYLEGKVIDNVLRNTAYTPPTTVYIGLFTSTVDKTAAGTEVSGGSYARQSMAFGAAGSASSSGQTTSNTAAVTFPNPTAAWGTVTYVAFFDASSGGNMLLFGLIDTPITVTSGGSAVQVPIGGLTITAA